MNTETLFFVQDPIWNILIRFIINLLVLFILIRFIYNRNSKKKDFMFTYFLMGIMIFLMCILLKNVEISLGIGFGLFALFSIIRFRTSNFTVKNMAYFFTVIGTSAINSLAQFPDPVRGPILINGIILLSTFLLEIFFHKKKSSLSSHQLIYDKLELLNPTRNQELLDDIALRIGKKIKKAEIHNIDLTKGNAELEVFYADKKNEDHKD
jgi:hypothetical protein